MQDNYKSEPSLCDLGMQRDYVLKAGDIAQLVSPGFNPHFYFLKKRNIDFNTKFKTTKILKEIEEKAKGTKACEGFLIITSKAQSVKKWIDKLDFTKIKMYL